MNIRKGVVLTILSLVLATANGKAQEESLVLRTVVDPETTTFQLRMTENVTHTPAKIGPQLFVLDMTGISTLSQADSQTMQSPLVSSYRLLNYKGADDRPHVALEISLKENAHPEVVRVANGLEVRISADPSEIDPSLMYEPAAAKVSSSKPSPIKQEKVPASGTVSLREVTVIQPESGNGLEVEINGDGKMEYRTMVLTNPIRLVVDIPKAVNRIKQKVLEVNTPPLKTVRIAQFSQRPMVTRVVMDLDANVPFDIQTNPKGLLVKLGNVNVQKSSLLEAFR